MTPQKVNQARFLLGWSQERLAQASGVPASMIAAFEAGDAIHPLRLAAVHKALVSEGVGFTASGCLLRGRERADAFTAQQCQAARRVLGWTQRRLALEAHMPLSTITVFEKSGAIASARGKAAADRLGIVRAALEAAGVIFLDAIGDGPGVKLRKAEP